MDFVMEWRREMMMTTNEGGGQTLRLSVGVYILLYDMLSLHPLFFLYPWTVEALLQETYLKDIVAQVTGRNGLM